MGCYQLQLLFELIFLTFPSKLIYSLPKPFWITFPQNYRNTIINEYNLLLYLYSHLFKKNYSSSSYESLPFYNFHYFKYSKMY